MSDPIYDGDAMEGRSGIAKPIRTGINCPQCGKEIIIPAFPRNLSMFQTMRLQMGTLGTDLSCDFCHHKFVYRTPPKDALPRPHILPGESPPSTVQTREQQKGGDASQSTEHV